MDHLEALRAFVAVNELGGFARAARRLRVSPSAVTRQVAGLEERLAVRLLQRTTRSLALTDAGARYLESARRILAALDEADGEARARSATPAGRLVVAAPRSFGARLVAPLLGEFLRLHQEVSGELTLSDRLVNLVEEGVDVAVRIGVLEDSSLRARVVGRVRRVLVASPGYLARSLRLRRPADLEEHDLIQASPLAAAPEWRFFRAGRETRLAIQPRLATNSADAAVGHAVRGGGVALVLSYQAQEAIRGGKLRVVLPGYEPPSLPIQLVYPASRLVSATLRSFIDLAAAQKWDFTGV